MSSRDEMRRLARESIGRGDAVGWFEQLYRRANGDWSHVPWADLSPNPHLVSWLASPEARRLGGDCLVVGCGLGDDAEALAAAGFRVVAFDVSATAIDACRARFPGSTVEYVVADVCSPPPEWAGRFGLVFESYTLQVLPPDERTCAMRVLAGLTSPAGVLVVLCRGRDRHDPIGELPWPIARDELDAFRAWGLAEVAFDDFLDDEAPPVRRFRARYERRAAAAPESENR